MTRDAQQHPAGTLALALSLALTLGAGASARAGDPVDPSGTWAIEGGGTLEVARALRGEGRYHLAWDTPTGRYTGVGLLRGERLLVGWGAGALGLMVARRGDAGWSCEWVTAAPLEARPGDEAWAGATLEGAHELSGTNPSGTPYEGRVTVERRGEVHHLSWSVAGQPHVGVGLQPGPDDLVIAFGAGSFGVATYDLSGGDAVEGRWCMSTGDGAGLERLRRTSRGPAAPVKLEAAGRAPGGRWTLEAGGSLEVVAAARGEGRYHLAWDTPGGRYSGVGLLRGERLVAGWGAGARGVMLMQRGEGGWTGEWVTSAPLEARPGGELWPGAALEGARELAGTNPSGTAYKGQVTVERRGDVHHLTWTIGDAQHTGVGLALDADHLVVAFGVGSFGVIVYDLSGGDAVEGRWGTSSGDAVAVERLRRP